MRVLLRAAVSFLALVVLGHLSADDHQHIVLSSTLARVVISTDRGAIDRFELLTVAPIKLPKHLDAFAFPSASNAVPVLADHWSGGTGGLRVGGVQPTQHCYLYSDSLSQRFSGLPSSSKTPWTISAQSATSVRLTLRIDGVAQWELTHVLLASRPTLQSTLRITNLSASTAGYAPHMLAIGGVFQDYGPGELPYITTYAHSGGVAGSTTNHGAPPTDGKMLVLSDGQNTVDYVGVRSRFFAAWWSPAPVQPARSSATTSSSVEAPEAEIVRSESDQHIETVSYAYQHLNRHETQAMLNVRWRNPVAVAPGGSTQFSWALNASGLSDRERERIDVIERRIEYVDGFYNFFKILANGMTACLKGIHWLLPNFGVAVIVLTILLKVLLFRTTWKQYASTFAMQKLAPEAKRIKEQYKGQQAQLKTMELYKKHGVNPLAGCLPMLIQIPIFMALYQAFSHSADLRGASFLWIHDLTLPDQVIGMTLSSSWPMIGNVLSLNPLPIIYVAVSMWMAWQQKPPEGSDEMQVMMGKMMRWMPLLFTLIFYNMPSGLVLYFTVQSLVSTLEIKYIKKKLGVP